MSAPRGVIGGWMRLPSEWLPFADAGGEHISFGRLMRLSLFQVSTGMAAVLLIGTLNRVMIVELGVATWLVALMVSLPLVFAPFRALIGFRSDRHRSAVGWRRVPYIWLGTIVQFSGLSFMPFALILLSGDTTGPMWIGQAVAAIAFLLVGAGMHTVQTVGLALATDLVPAERQPRVVALLSVMLLVGMLISSIGFGAVLAEFSQIRLIQVIQASALITITLNMIALWKQEGRNPSATLGPQPADPGFRETWARLAAQGPWTRRLVALGLGTAAFAMQDVLLEPYGGQVLGLGVGATTLLTALTAGGNIAGFVQAARLMDRGTGPDGIAGLGSVVGVAGFAFVILAAPFDSVALFAAGAAVIGLGAGFFAHATLTACMKAAPPGMIGLAIGAWGSVQASAGGLAVAASGGIRDAMAEIAGGGALGPALASPAGAYGTVYLLEIVLLFLTMAAIGPLVRRNADLPRGRPSSLPGLAGSHR